MVHKLSNKFDRLFDHLSTLNKTGSLDLGTTEAEQALPDYVKHAMKKKPTKEVISPIITEEMHKQDKFWLDRLLYIRSSENVGGEKNPENLQKRMKMEFCSPDMNIVGIDAIGSNANRQYQREQTLLQQDDYRRTIEIREQRYETQKAKLGFNKPSKPSSN